MLLNEFCIATSFGTKLEPSSSFDCKYIRALESENLAESDHYMFHGYIQMTNRIVDVIFYISTHNFMSIFPVYF